MDVGYCIILSTRFYPYPLFSRKKEEYDFTEVEQKSKQNISRNVCHICIWSLMCGNWKVYFLFFNLLELIIP